MEITGTTGTTGPVSPDSPRGDPAKIRQAARDFESLLVGQMLRSMREGDGWLGAGEDQAGMQAMEFAEEQFARALAASGGLGLSGIIVRGLTASSSPPHTPAAPAVERSSTGK